MFPDMFQVVDVHSISLDHLLHIIFFPPPHLMRRVDSSIADDGLVGQNVTHLERRGAARVDKIGADAIAAPETTPPLVLIDV